MRQLPERPDLEQLRRQARELRRASVKRHDSEPGRRPTFSRGALAAAQLALARQYGFPSWARLKQEVVRRRNQPVTGSRLTTSPMVRSWESMRDWMASLLLKRTGRDVGAWKAEIAGESFEDEAALRQWLAERGVKGYSQRLLVWERFGYPGYMTAAGHDLIARQYQDRPQLRPILDAILAALPEVSPVITVQARKTYISLVGERRTFAVIQATTKRRVDLGLRLDDVKPAGRLRAARGLGNGSMPVKISLESAQDLDAEAIRLLKRAHAANR
jgi:uncharacterized protein DUF5655